MDRRGRCRRACHDHLLGAGAGGESRRQPAVHWHRRRVRAACDRGMELYLKLNVDKVRPYKITLIKRDVKDPGGANAKIAVQELLTQDNVDILAGWIYSPNAIASAPIVTAFGE